MVVKARKVWHNARVANKLDLVRMTPRTDEPVVFSVVRMVADDRTMTVINDDVAPPRYVRGTGADEACLARGDAEGVLQDGNATRSARVRALLQLGQAKEAEALLHGVSEQEDPVAHAAVALQDHRLADAQRCIALAFTQNASSLPAALLQSRVSLARNDVGDAVEQLSEIARGDGEHAVARFTLGQIILAAGDPARAGTLFEQAGAINRSYLEPTLAMVQMLAESRQVGEALAQLQQLALDNPHKLAPRHLQVRMLLDIGDAEQALLLARNVQRHPKADSNSQLLLAEALLDVEQTAEAESLLKGMADKPDAHPRAVRLLARAELLRDDADSALQRLRALAEQMGPGESGEVWAEVAQTALQRGRKAEADEAFVALVASTDLNAVVNGALMARQSGAFARSRRLAERAKEMVAGTSAEHQLDLFLQSLPQSML
jgi:predicted Zn-dependent protease